MVAPVPTSAVYMIAAVALVLLGLGAALGNLFATLSAVALLMLALMVLLFDIFSRLVAISQMLEAGRAADVTSASRHDAGRR